MLILISSNAAYAVPFVFKAGEPAKASEVNGNFTALNDKITDLMGDVSLSDLKKRVGDLEKISSTCPKPDNGFGITYVKKTATLGSTVGLDTILVKVPFVDFKTGNRYTIIFPSLPTSIMINFVADDESAFCATTSISGYPSLSHQLYVVRTIDIQPGGVSKVSASIKTAVDILVENTKISIYYMYTKLEQSPNIGLTASDFSSSINTTTMVSPVEQIQLIDDLIDYIDIVKAP